MEHWPLIAVFIHLSTLLSFSAVSSACHFIGIASETAQGRGGLELVSSAVVSGVLSIAKMITIETDLKLQVSKQHSRPFRRGTQS